MKKVAYAFADYIVVCAEGERQIQNYLKIVKLMSIKNDDDRTRKQEVKY